MYHALSATFYPARGKMRFPSRPNPQKRGKWDEDSASLTYAPHYIMHRLQEKMDVWQTSTE